MEIKKRSELCGKKDSGVLVAYIPAGTVFRGRISNNPPHVWIAAESNRLVCVSEPSEYMPVGGFAFTGITDSERGAKKVNDYEPLDAILVIQD